MTVNCLRICPRCRLGWTEIEEHHESPPEVVGLVLKHINQDRPAMLTARSVYRRHRAGLRSIQDVTAALDLLSERGILERSRRKSTSGGGRPTVDYRVL